jgi:hypothetical protein
MQKSAAHLAGSATAMASLGYSPGAVYQKLLFKGASAEDATFLVKEAFIPQMLARGATFLGTKALPQAAGWLGSHAASGPGANVGRRIMGWGGQHAGSLAKSFEAAGTGLAKDPWGTIGHGAKNFLHGSLLAGGHGAAATAGKGLLAGTTAMALFGGGGNHPPQQQPQPYTGA